MSSELHKYIESSIKKKESLYNAEVINFPNDKKINKDKNFQDLESELWSINNKSNADQLRAVVGICFIFSALVLMGLYSNLI